MTCRIGASGVELTLSGDSGGRSEKVRLRLASIGRRAAGEAPGIPRVERGQDGTVSLRYANGVVEIYKKARYGIEQSFRIESPPPNPGNGELKMLVAIDTGFEARQLEGQDCVWLADASGQPRFYYSQLAAFDATGRLLPARMHLRDDDNATIELAIDDTSARYPLTIDPRISPDTAAYTKYFENYWPYVKQLQYYYRLDHGVPVLQGPYWRFVKDPSANHPPYGSWHRLVEYGHYENGARTGLWLSYLDHPIPAESSSSASWLLKRALRMPEIGRYNDCGQKQGAWKGGNQMEDPTDPEVVDIMEQYRIHTSDSWTQYLHFLGYEMNYDDGIPTGAVSIFNNPRSSGDPFLEMQGEILDGEKDGLWSFYFENTETPGASILLKEAEYRRGRLHGAYTRYLPDGEIAFAGEYRNGLKSGKWEWFDWCGGDPDDTEPPSALGVTSWNCFATFEDGILSGPWAEYLDETRTTVTVEGRMKNGKMDGIWKKYGTANKLWQQKTYREGVLDGVSKFWHPGTNILQRLETWRNGVLDGPYATWLSNGKRESRGMCRDGLRTNTTWEFWGYPALGGGVVRDTYIYGNVLETFSVTRVWEDGGIVLIRWRSENGVGGIATLNSSWKDEPEGYAYTRFGTGRLVSLPDIATSISAYHDVMENVDQWGNTYNIFTRCGTWHFETKNNPETPNYDFDFGPCPGNPSGLQANFTWEITDPVNRTVQFHDVSTSTSGAVTSWQWHAEGADFSTASDPVFSFGANGVVDVSLTVGNAGGTQDTITKSVNLSGSEIHVSADPDFDVPADGKTPVRVRAVITDAGGAPLPGLAVEFSQQPEGLGNFSSASVSTDSDGVAETTFTPHKAAELGGARRSVIAATVNGNRVATVIEYAANILYLVARKPADESGHVVIPADSGYPAWLEVGIMNDNGRAMDGQDVTFRLGAGAPGALEGVGGGGSGSEITVASDAHGRAEVLYRFDGSLSGSPIDVPVEIEAAGQTLHATISVGMDLELVPVGAKGPFYRNTAYGLFFEVRDTAHPNLDLWQWNLDAPDAWAGRTLGVHLDIDWINEPKGTFWNNLLPGQSQSVTTYHGDTSFDNGHSGRAGLYAMEAPSLAMGPHQLPALTFSGKGPHLLMATVKFTDLQAGALPSGADLDGSNNLRVFGIDVEDGPTSMAMDALCAFKATTQRQQLARDAISAVGDAIPAVKVIDSMTGWVDFACDLFNGNWSAVTLKLATEQINYLQGKVDAGELVLDSRQLKLLQVANLTQLSGNYYDKLKSTSALPQSAPTRRTPIPQSDPQADTEGIANASAFLEAMTQSGGLDGFLLLATPPGSLSVSGNPVALHDSASALATADLEDSLGFRSGDSILWLLPADADAHLALDPLDGEPLRVSCYAAGAGATTWLWEYQPAGTATGALDIAAGIPGTLEVTDDTGSHSVAAVHRLFIVATAGEHGSVAATENPLPAEYGDDVSVAVEADAGCRIDTIRIDGEYIPVTNPHSQTISWTSLATSHHVLATFFVDGDDDGLPDDWESRMTVESELTDLDPNSDDDGDKVSNLGEYRAGTDPLDTESAPAPFDIEGIVTLSGPREQNTVSLEDVSVRLVRDGTEAGSAHPDPVTGSFLFPEVEFGSFEIEVSVDNPAPDPDPQIRIFPAYRYFPVIACTPPPIHIAVTLSDPGPAPLGVTASKGSFADKTVVTWETVEGATEYSIYRNSSDDVRGAKLLGNTTGNSFEDTEENLEGYFSYFVRATLPGGFGAFSAPALGWRGGVAPSYTADTLDQYAIHFSTLGEATASMATGGYETYDGTDALKFSGLSGPPKAETLQSIVEGPGMVSFSWRIYSAAGAGDPDLLAFEIDGTRAATRVGDTKNDYRRVSVAIPPGVHEVEWIYEKHHAAQSWEAAWFDQIHYVLDDLPGPGALTTSQGTFADHIDLTWPAGSADSWEILRSTTGRYDDAIVVGTSASAAWTDHIVAQGTLYTYWVRIVGEGGSSRPSPSAEGWVGAYPRENWRFGMSCGPVVLDSRGLAFSAGENEMFAFDPSGNQVGSTSVSALWGLKGPVLSEDRILYAGDMANSRLVAIDTADMSLSWQLGLMAAHGQGHQPAHPLDCLEPSGVLRSGVRGTGHRQWRQNPCRHLRRVAHSAQPGRHGRLEDGAWRVHRGGPGDCGRRHGVRRINQRPLLRTFVLRRRHRVGCGYRECDPGRRGGRRRRNRLCSRNCRESNPCDRP